jgi:hypothetical protein
MRLHVGPHPAAVYWRRRAVVLVGLALMVLIITYACSGTSSSGAGGSATPTTTLLTPTSGQPTKSTTTPPPSTPTATPFTLAQPPKTGPCTDDEISLTAAAAPASPRRGQPVQFTLTIKNVSTRACARDIGAEAQELILYNGDTVIWSSDDCSTNHSADVQNLSAGESRPFTLTWNGVRSRSGTSEKTCTNGTQPDPGDYQLVARLGSERSAPASVHLTA